MDISAGKALLGFYVAPGKNFDGALVAPAPDLAPTLQYGKL
jgi:hypothetical protein